MGNDAPATDSTVASVAVGKKDELLKSEFVQSLPFWIPSLALVLLFIYGSIAWNAIISLTDWSGFGTVDYSDLDFGQYQRAMNDPELWVAFRNTFALLVAFTVVCLVVGLLLALLLDRKIRFSRGIRTTYLLPFSLAFVVTAQIWLWLYNFEFGVVNVTLDTLGLPRQHWIGDPSIVLGAIIVALVWQFSGYAMVVYLAGLRAIPDDQFEAAKIDGASSLSMYWNVILPQLRASTASAAVVLMVFALKAFDFLYSMFGSYRPRKGTDILATKMVREAFKLREWGYGASIAIIMFLLALAIITPHLYTRYKRGDL